jgi:hypothetical protein
VPVATPYTVPALTVAIDVLLLVHVPPETPSVSVVLDPTVVDVVPEIVPALTVAKTLTHEDALALPHEVVIV